MTYIHTYIHAWKTWICIVLGLTLVGCQPPSLTNQPSNTAKSLIKPAAFQIKNLEGEATSIRKIILPTQRVEIDNGRRFNFKDKETFTFQVAASDFPYRRFILNLLNGPGNIPNAELGWVKLNGETILEPDFQWKKPKRCSLHWRNKHKKNKIERRLHRKGFEGLKDISLEVDLQPGQNTLEVKLVGKRNSAVDVSIEGYLPSVWIPGARHSSIPDDETIRSIPHYKDWLGIKFLEGMKVRLVPGPNGRPQFVDENGISLAAFNELIEELGVTHIEKSFNESPEQSDIDEARLESMLESDAPNKQLFYHLIFGRNVDIWEKIDALEDLPYLEEAYPSFQTAAPSIGTPGEPEYAETEFTGVIFNGSNVKKNQWLKNTRVMADGSNPGAWDLYNSATRQYRSIYGVYVLEGGIQHSSLVPSITTHEDLNNINLHVNIDTTQMNLPVYQNHLSHGTLSTGIVGAAADNGLGVSGIAFRNPIHHVVAYGHAKDNNNVDMPPKCLGFFVKCDPTAEALSYSVTYSLTNPTTGTAVILIEGWNPPYTVEQVSPEARFLILYITYFRGHSVVIPAGNVYKCEDIKRTNYSSQIAYENALTECLNNYVAGPLPDKPYSGTDVRRYRFTKPDGSKVWLPWPDFGSIIVGALQLDGSGIYIPDPSTGELSPVSYPNGGTAQPGMAWGKSRAGNIQGILDPNGQFTFLEQTNHSGNMALAGGHGIDVSAPGHEVWSTTSNVAPPNKKYGTASGTSAASAVIAGIVALVLDQNECLHALELRKILRQTAQQNLNQVAGMVNAYTAALDAGTTGRPCGHPFPTPTVPNPSPTGAPSGTPSGSSPPSSSPTPSGPAPSVTPLPSIPPTVNGGIMGTFYANTVYIPPEPVNGFPAETHQPFTAKAFPTLDFSGNGDIGNDPLAVGVSDFYVAIFEGYLDVPADGTYPFTLEHDDGVHLEIDDQIILNYNQSNPDDRDRNFVREHQFSLSLTSGKHKVRLMYFQINHDLRLHLYWQPPGTPDIEIIPVSQWSYEPKTVPAYQPQPRVLGRFFVPNVYPPFPPNYPLFSLFYDRLWFDDTNPTVNIAGDPFGIGINDDYSAFFSGFIKLPDNYPEGEYNLDVWGDDEATLYVGTQVSTTLAADGKAFGFNMGFGPFAASRTINMEHNVYYPIVITYKEVVGDAILSLFWSPPGGTPTTGDSSEVVPANALFH